MNLNTPHQKDGAKLVLRMLGHGPKNPAIVTSRLSHPEKGVYNRSTDAKNFLKDLVADDNFPIEKKENRLIRTDLQQVNT